MAEPSAEALRKAILTRHAALNTERSQWESHWRDCARFILPRKGRFLWTDANRGGSVNNAIIDNTPTMSLRTLASGLMSGLTSPARPWFKLVTREPGLMEEPGVKIWMEECEDLLREIFNRSNIYQALHSTYEELGCFGTGVVLIYSDFHTVIRAEALTAGQYWLATSNRGEVDTLFRRVSMTVGQIVEEFAPLQGDKRDFSTISTTVKSLWDNGNRDAKFAILHAIEPNPDHKHDARLSWRKRYRSIWIEEGGEQSKILRRSGFDVFPALCPRWHPTPGDVYGRSCGMDALEDSRQLQAQQRAKQRGIEKMVDPPLNAPAGSLVNDLPGGINFYDIGGATPPMASPLYQVQPRLAELAQDMEEVRRRVRDAFFADLWLMITEIDRTGVTATEIDARREEKMLMLGPVLEQLHHELLDPLIDLAFAHAQRAGILPEPPEAVLGQKLQVQYTSQLSQAQRATATGSIERVIGFSGNLAGIDPSVLDSINLDETVRTYGDAIGAPAKIMRSPDEVEAIRQQRAQAAQEQEAMQQSTTIAQNLELVAKATDRPNAVTALADSLGGG